jgi:hypothetical protein
MILISHRGNINGRNEVLENDPNYIDIALSSGFEVEIDIWTIDNKLFLGHDEPKYNIELNWISERYEKLWIHCKNIESLLILKKSNYYLNYFWHQSDDITLTSKGFLWTFPGKQLTEYSIACMPEIKKFNNIDISFGICSDFIEKYK